MDPEFWNERYSGEEYVYGKSPNAFFRSVLDTLSPGHLLLPCEGEGRNAVYAASKGWIVSAFDQSSMGREKALGLAQEAGVQIDYELSLAQDFRPGDKKYDLIAFIFAHFPAGLREVIHARAARWLRPGGMILLEAFHPRQMAFTSGGPKDPSMLYTSELLHKDFEGLEALQLEETQILIDEGDFHRGPAEVVRYLGMKQ